MKYLYHKSENGNFGDDLNAWLWPKFFGQENASDNNVFLGIGSILFNEFPLLKDISDKNKIVFGTGIRPRYEPFKIDDTWDIKFLRGPLSSHTLGNRFEYIADSAYALRLVKEFEAFKNVEKKYEVSVIPYYRSVSFFDWEAICKTLGFNYISPLGEKGIDYTLKEMAASKVIITEAMHGAIISDILRVPWNRFVLTTPLTEGPMVSEFKWMDWQFSIEVPNANITNIRFLRKSFVHRWVKKISNDTVNAEFLVKKTVKDDILKKLAAVKDFYLSSDAVVNRIDSRIMEKVSELKKQLDIG